LPEEAKMPNPLSNESLAQLFVEARTHHGFLDREVPDDLLHRLYDLVKWGPTAFNMTPARFVFVKSREAKEKLASALLGSNVEQTMQAPVTAIVATDSRFYDELPRLFPAFDVRALYADDEAGAHTAAFRNASMQGGYLILASRALGLDSGGMSGFDNAKVDELFFPDGRWRSNFLLNLGYGSGKLYPRGPRLEFDEACRVV
jgi:3-hydroxypropanoate dehydrogenase